MQFHIFYNGIGDGEILLVVRGYGTFAMGGVLYLMNVYWYSNSTLPMGFLTWLPGAQTDDNIIHYHWKVDHLKKLVDQQIGGDELPSAYLAHGASIFVKKITCE